MNMDRERLLYDTFVDTLIDKVQSGEATPKELEIVMNFLKNNNIQATKVSYNSLSLSMFILLKFCIIPLNFIPQV